MGEITLTFASEINKNRNEKGILIKRLTPFLSMVFVLALCSCSSADNSVFQAAQSAVTKFKGVNSYICDVKASQTADETTSQINSGSTDGGLSFSAVPDMTAPQTLPTEVKYLKANGKTEFLELSGNDLEHPDVVEYYDGSKMTITMSGSSKTGKFNGIIPGMPVIMNKNYLKSQKETESDGKTVITLTFNEGKAGSISGAEMGDITLTYHLDSSGMITGYSVDTAMKQNGRVTHSISDFTYSRVNQSVTIIPPDSK